MKRFLAFVAIVEIAVAIALFLFVRSGTCVTFSNTAQLGGRMSRGTPDADPTGGVPVVMPSSASPLPSSAPGVAPSGSLQSGSAEAGSAEVPDPNCVAKTTTGLLNAGPASPAPSCAPTTIPAQ